MSAIDRAFIKAYSDHAKESAANEAAPRKPTRVPENPRAMDSAQPVDRADSPRRSASRTKRSAAAAALRAGDAGATLLPQQQNAVEPNPQIQSSAQAQTATPKMVVGRQALRKLAENAVVPAPHTEFPSQRSSQPNPLQRAELRHADASAGSTYRTRTSATDPIDPPSETPQISASRQDIAAQRLRVDPPGKLSRPSLSQHKAVPDPAVSSTAVTRDTPSPQLSIASLASSASPAPADDRQPPIIGLEVDSFLWPPAVQTLLERAGSEFDSLATLICDEATNGNQVIGVTGIESGHGSTTIALCLAKALGTRDLRVCIIDGNFKRPRLAESVGLAAEQGLEAALPGRTKLDEILVESLEDRVTLLPLCSPVAADELARAKLRLTAAVGELRERFDIVLVDAGHLSVSSAHNANILATGLVDSAILVGRSNCDAVSWRRSQQAIDELQLPCLGAIENCCSR